MTVYRAMSASRVLMGRMGHELDLLKELTAICEKEGIRLGWIRAIGAVKRAYIGFYDQGTHQYHNLELPRPLEILQLLGNVSLLENRPMVHAHITLADSDGRTYGGHLLPGTIVFACEFAIEILEGPDLVRALDRETGLPLWSMA